MEKQNLKRNRLSIFAKEKPRAIYRNSDEILEEPIQKVDISQSPEVKVQNSINTLQEKLIQIQESWEQEPSGRTTELTNNQTNENLDREHSIPVESKESSPDKERRSSDEPSFNKTELTEPFQRTSIEAVQESNNGNDKLKTITAIQSIKTAIMKPLELASVGSKQVEGNFSRPTSQEGPQLQYNNASEQQNNAFFRPSTVNTENYQSLLKEEQQLYEQNVIAQEQQLKKEEPKKSEIFVVNGVKYIGLRELGKGGSATVHEVMTSDLQQCALKIINLKEENDELCGKNAIMKEIAILQQLKGLNITLELLDYEFTETQAFIVMELGDIDLKTYLRENPVLSSIKVLSLFEDMVEKILIMHQAGYIHGDIKPHNFMFYHSKLMVIDFGISKQMQYDQTSIYRDSLSGTPKYLAPEVIAAQYKEPGAHIHRASDVFSLGVILYEMTTNESPFEDILKRAKNPLVFIDILRRRDFKIDFAKIKNEFIKEIAIKMLDPDDTKRIGLEQVLAQLRAE